MNLSISRSSRRTVENVPYRAYTATVHKESKVAEGTGANGAECHLQAIQTHICKLVRGKQCCSCSSCSRTRAAAAAAVRGNIWQPKSAPKLKAVKAAQAPATAADAQ